MSGKTDGNSTNDKRNKSDRRTDDRRHNVRRTGPRRIEDDADTDPGLFVAVQPDEVINPATQRQPSIFREVDLRES